MERIREHFEKLTILSKHDWDIFASGLEEKIYAKKSVILKAGEVENYLSFIVEGIVRLYIPDVTQDFTFGFVFENSFVSAYDSFLTRLPSTYTIETISPVKLWKISHSHLIQIYNSTTAGNLIGRLAAEDLFLKKSARELSLLKNSAEERYKLLFTERPELIRQIPLKYIASYIGVTPQALSRIRKRIS